MALVRFPGKRDPERLICVLDGDAETDDCSILPPRASFTKDSVLDIFHINDLHSHLFDQGRYTFGALAEPVRQAREEGRNVLFLSAGDDLIGTSLDHCIGYDDDDFIGHPAYSAYALAGVDAVVPGNHDFDMGLDALARSIRENATFPVLSANLEHHGSLTGLVHPGAIIVLPSGIRAGIIGLTTPGQCRSREDSVYEITDPLQACLETAARLKPHCDALIVLSHLGLALGSTFAAVQGYGDRELAERLGAEQTGAGQPGAGPDLKPHLIVGGHTHHILNTRGLAPESVVRGIPILQAGCNGDYLGHATLRLGEGVECTDAVLYPAATLPQPKDPGLAFFRTPVGQALEQLHAPFAALDLPAGFSFARYKREQGMGEDPLANYISDAVKAELEKRAVSVDCVVLDASSLVYYFPDGISRITLDDIYRLMPYTDTINLFALSTGMVVRMVEENLLRRRGRGEEYQERGFLYFSRELRYEAGAGGRELAGLTLGEKDLLAGSRFTAGSGGDSFLFAAPNYLQGLAREWETRHSPGGDAFFNIHDHTIRRSSIFLRKLLIDHIASSGIGADRGIRRDGRFSIRE